MKTCSIIGHRKIEETKELEIKVKNIIINLIEKEKVTEFLFGSKSEFNDLCYDIVTDLKGKYFNINRIFVRAEYPTISDDYYNYLKKFYEDTYFYDKKLISNKFSYIRRNQVVIDKSDFCLFYFDINYIPKTKNQSKTDIYIPNPTSARRSGTSIAYNYAVKKLKTIINVVET